jgi:hypothetical protein
MTKRPSGLGQSKAIFARILFGAAPADAVSCIRLESLDESLALTAWLSASRSCSR